MHSLDKLRTRLVDTEEFLELAASENDEISFNDAVKDIDKVERQIHDMEFNRMFSGKMDSHNAYLDIQSGSGGTEAQDWAEMLLRMYLRFGDRHGFKTESIEVSPGEVAGIKSATIKFNGDYAYGWARTETGVHRLVRKSPFDSGNRRHTSFASVFVYPEIDDDITIEINPADLRVDTYRAQGAGGQHVNVTDSAIRITHLPTNIVVKCQTERSQLQNKNNALKLLRAKLLKYYEAEEDKRVQRIKGEYQKAEWGNQARSYVMQPYKLVKDHRTGHETPDINRVLDGKLDDFVEEYLRHQQTLAI